MSLYSPRHVNLSLHVIFKVFKLIIFMFICCILIKKNMLYFFCFYTNLSYLIDHSLKLITFCNHCISVKYPLGNLPTFNGVSPPTTFFISTRQRETSFKEFEFSFILTNIMYFPLKTYTFHS